MCRLISALALVALIVATGALANPIPEAGYVGVYPDVGASTRCIYDTQTGELHFYVVHNMMAPFVQAQYLYFSAPKPACFVATHVGDMPGPGGFILSGDSQTGVEIFVLPICAASPGAGHVMTIVYSASGLTPTDCYYPIQPDGYGRQVLVDCGGLEHFLADRVGLINPSHPGLCVVATEETTWGRVKALYR